MAPFLSLLLMALMLAGAVLAGLWAGQHLLIYFPDRSRPTPPPGVEAIRLDTADGLALLAWWMPPREAEAPVLLYLHGNGGNLGHRASAFEAFATLGWGVMMPAWRGYGGNPGRPSETGLLRDAEAGLEALAARGIPPARIVVWGESLGTGVGVRLAAEKPGRIAALILESPYTSLLDLARLHYPVLPAGLLLRDRYESLSRIGDAGVPALVMVGGRDTLVPPEMGRRLAAAARAPAEVWEAPLAGHNELGAHGAIAAAAAFLALHLPSR
jgi:fermentation-respiration switch protein FrsA (DUF1100 family)